VCDGGEQPLIEISGVGLFHLCQGEALICCTLVPGVSMQTTMYWLMSFVIPVYLLLDASLEFLHASAVEIDGGAIAFLADAMGGKSTIASFFLDQGHALLTDDQLGIFEKEIFLAVPGIPFVRPYRQVEDVGTPASRFVSNPIPLRALYFLELGSEPTRVTPISGAHATIALARNRRLLASKKLPHLAKWGFLRIAALSSSIQVSKLAVPRDFKRLREVYEAVLADLGESCA
jgi:hypothetical protein